MTARITNPTLSALAEAHTGLLECSLSLGTASLDPDVRAEVLTLNRQLDSLISAVGALAEKIA